MMKSLFSHQQWLWIAARFQEGYTLSALAEFLGVHPATVRRGLMRLGFKPFNQKALPPLSERRREFLRQREESAP